MAALTADNTTIPPTKALAGEGGNGFLADYSVAASTVIYKHGFVGFNTAGHLKMLGVPASQATIVGDRFVGISMEHIASQTAAGDARCAVLTEGIFQWALASAVIADIGKPVFASDDNTLTKVAGNPFVGWIIDFVSAGQVLVRMGGLSSSTGQLMSRTSASIDLTAASDLVSIIHQTENHNGLLIYDTALFLSTATDATSCVLTLQDTAATTLGIVHTSTVTAGDAIGDVVIPAAGVVRGASTGDAMVFVPADLGVDAIVTTASGTGAGRIVLMAFVL